MRGIRSECIYRVHYKWTLGRTRQRGSDGQDYSSTLAHESMTVSGTAMIPTQIQYAHLPDHATVLYLSCVPAPLSAVTEEMCTAHAHDSCSRGEGSVSVSISGVLGTSSGR